MWPSCCRVVSPPRGSFEKRILEDFTALLDALEINELACLDSVAWNRVERLVGAWAGWGKHTWAQGRVADSLHMLGVLLRRIEHHRDERWSGLVEGRRRWTRYAGFYRGDEDGVDYCSLEAGFWRWRSKRSGWVSIGFGVYFYEGGPPALYAYQWASPTPEESAEVSWDARDVRRIFARTCLPSGAGGHVAV